MHVSRRVNILVVPAILLTGALSLSVSTPAVGQVKKVEDAPPLKGVAKKGFDPKDQGKQPLAKPGTKFSAIKLVENEEDQKKIDNALAAVEGGDWSEACDFLQAVLDGKQDSFITIETNDPKAGKKSHAISAKRQANLLLASLPAEGLNVYELKFGAIARQLLDEAKKNGNRALVGEIASRFLHTEAGVQANDLLATSFLDRGDYYPAAMCYRLLLGPDLAKAKVSDLTLFKATLAFHRAGQEYVARAQEAEEILLARLKTNGGLGLANGQTATIKQVQAVLKDKETSEAANPHDWPMVNGNLARNAQAIGSPPMLDSELWARKTLMDKSDETGEPEVGPNAKALLETALKDSRNIPNMPIMSGGFPVSSNGILFYRTYAGITAVYLRDLRDKDGNVEAKAGSIYWRSTPFDGSLGNIFEMPNNITPLTSSWIQPYRQMGLSNVLFENSTVGTLTTDNRMVYAVDDLILPIPPQYLAPSTFWTNASYVSEELRKFVLQNKLRAQEISSGKIAWELGGGNDKTEEFKDSHFLCAPIPVGGKLYVLNEKNNGDLRLICVEAHRVAANGPQKKEDWVVNVVPPIQKLGTVRNEHAFRRDAARRANAIHLAYAEGILVCPTNAGEIFGVDLLSQSLAWAYKYRERPLTSPINQKGVGVVNQQLTLSNSNWKVAPPVIVDGKVVFTAPDSSSVCCLNLRDGSELWSVPRQESDVFFAGVFQDKVLIVGKNMVRAVRLADGTRVGEPLSTGDLPSGQGVASNNIYYLPLRKGEICAIDLAKWEIKAHNQTSRTAGEPPGNLVFCEGMVLSQTPDSVVAYPQLFAKLADAEEAFKKDPSLTNLLNRGELRLADGQMQKAVEDLIAVLAKEPPAEVVSRAKSRLYEALSYLLDEDFAAYAPKYLKHLKELTVVPGQQAEQLRREAKYWRIVGQGREQQGELVDAFLAFKEYGASPLFKDKGIPSLEDPQRRVPARMWFRGRISTMFAKATSAQRVTLEKQIAQEWAAVRKTNDQDAMRQFATMFDATVKVGREARFELADVVIAKKSKASFLEAELNLRQMRMPAFQGDPETTGRALEALARLEAAKGTDESLRAALTSYREINKDYAKVVLRDGKTGAELFSELDKDARFQALLNEMPFHWGGGEIKCRKLDGTNQGYVGFVFQPEGQGEGELPTLVRQHRLVLELFNNANPSLRFVDTATNKERWKLTLPNNFNLNSNLQYFYSEQNAGRGPANARYRFYHVQGHLAVVQVGLSAFGVDLDEGTVLWHHLLFDSGSSGSPTSGVGFNTDDQGVWVVQISNGQTVKSRLGQIGAVEANYVALMTLKGLVALDPVTGETLWTKSNLTTNLEVFGDDQHIYFMETANGAPIGAGRCLRASDGAAVDVPDFGFFYRNRQRIVAGNRILTAEHVGRTTTMRLYDVLAGKDVWKRVFDKNPAVLVTADTNQCGVIERDTGKLILVEVRTGKEIMTANMKQFRVEDEDLRDLHEPLLLDDGQNYFVALNAKFANPKILANSLGSNFSGGVKCLPVNGWVCCLDRKGEFLWHGHDRFVYQMIVVEQFKMLPMLLFSSRYAEQAQNAALPVVGGGFGGPAMPGGGFGGGLQYTYTARSGSIAKADGKSLWWSPEARSDQAQFFGFSVDLKLRTISMFGVNLTYQHYFDDMKMKK